MPTGRQVEAYRYIANFIQKEGYSPTYQKIADALGLSSLATVHKHVQALIESGHLVRSGATQLAIVPAKLQENYNRCETGHPVIYFLVAQCPLCASLRVNGFLREDLAKFQQPKTAVVAVGSLEGGREQRRKA